MTTLHWIKADQIEIAWQWIEPLLRRMYDAADGRVTIEDARALLNGDWLQLHVALDDDGHPQAALVSEIKTYPRKKVCALVGIVGDRRESWTHHLGEVEEWARGLGCRGIRLEDARKGWQRESVLESYRSTVVFEKDLE